MNLEPHSAVPLYEQIYQYIKNDIQKGRISAGEKTPFLPVLWPAIWKSAEVRWNLPMNSLYRKVISNRYRTKGHLCWMLRNCTG